MDHASVGLSGGEGVYRNGGGGIKKKSRRAERARGEEAKN
jgi:hypothetical protein